MDLANLERTLQTRIPGLMDAARRYAVLVPLVERSGEYHLLYEVRARTMKRQPGEVCFPGGRMEEGESPEVCALRETEEELGIPASAVKMLGRLDFIAHRANFILYPILGVVDRAALFPRLRPSPAEVEEVFLVPLSHLLHTSPLEYDYKLIPETGAGFPYELLGIPRDYKWQPGGENIPVYPWQGRAIWGLTGRITRHLVQLIQAAESPV
ncbi:MAG: CoA pyrophosphatase [Lawsonibacter sp.]|nr:CoA pyrophosphatase [Lawsonibacter sp.]